MCGWLVSSSNLSSRMLIALKIFTTFSTATVFESSYEETKSWLYDFIDLFCIVIDMRSVMLEKYLAAAPPPQQSMTASTDSKILSIL